MYGNGSRSWLLQALTGLLLLILAAWHMARVHLGGSVGGLPSYAEAISVFKNPSTALLAVLFTVLVAFHAFNGIASVLVEAGINERKAGRVAFLGWITVSIYVILLAVYAAFFL